MGLERLSRNSLHLTHGRNRNVLGFSSSLVYSTGHGILELKLHTITVKAFKRAQSPYTVIDAKGLAIGKVRRSQLLNLPLG